MRTEDQIGGALIGIAFIFIMLLFLLPKKRKLKRTPKLTLEAFEKELIALLVFAPVSRPNWKVQMKNWYKEYIKLYYPTTSIQKWAEFSLQNNTMQHNGFMLKSKAIKERDEKIRQGHKFIPAHINQSDQYENFM